MTKHSVVPRRAWQRRRLRIEKESPVLLSPSGQEAWSVSERGIPSISGSGSEYEMGLDSSSGSSSETESDDSADERAGWNRNFPGFDSGYGSQEEDPDEKARYYDELLERFRAEGPTLADHSRNTVRMEEEQEAKWEEFCKYRRLDPMRTLKACDSPVFKVYLVWRVENSRIKKESSVLTYWKLLSMVYSQKMASWMKEEVLYDIRNWIRTYVTPTYGLDTSRKEKAGLFVEDLAMLLYHHWVRDEEIFAHERLRVQLAANLILAGATATRPGALIGQLLYEHLEFQLFPPLSGGPRPRIVLKVNLKHIKRSGGTSDPKEFAFREDDMLIYDPLIPIMAMALADDAFENGFTSPRQIYNLIVPKGSDRLRILWKQEWRQRPVFRDIERMDDGVR
ncbi:hypothetical protein J7T55_004196, partial [Diaporthe amygdali]|uniref:uncharacterized protein n=1 Tax=Phomopsis amygdali TaxID=1214568 RepID=UPI0022FF439C